MSITYKYKANNFLHHLKNENNSINKNLNSDKIINKYDKEDIPRYKKFSIKSI